MSIPRDTLREFIEEALLDKNVDYDDAAEIADSVCERLEEEGFLNDDERMVSLSELV